MTQLVKNQLEIMIVMTAGGCAAGMIQSLFNAYRRVAFSSGIKDMALELFSWIAGGFLLSEFLYVCDNGKITFTALAASAIGLLLWKKTFCAILTRTGEYNGEENRQSK